jgi:hypothetical protein
MIDSMVSVLAHELAEAVTDPDIQDRAWEDGYGEEVI